MLSKNYAFSLFLILIAFGNISCSVKGQEEISNDKQEEIFLKYLTQIMPGDSSIFGSYMVIPANSSDYCLEKLKKFMASYNGSFTKYILVGHSDEELRHTYSEHLIDKKYVHQDTKLVWQNTGLSVASTPQIFYIVDDQIVNAVEVAVENIDNQLQELEDWNVSHITVNVYANPKFHPHLAKIKGKIAPSISSRTMDGMYFDLAKSNFEVIVLSFWARGCMYCLLEIESLNKFSKEYMDKGVQVVALYNEGPESFSKFITSNKKIPAPEFPVIVNAQKFIDDFNVKSFPRTMIINDQKVVEDTFGYIISHDGKTDTDVYELGTYYQTLKGRTNRILWAASSLQQLGR